MIDLPALLPNEAVIVAGQIDTHKASVAAVVGTDVPALGMAVKRVKRVLAYVL